MAIEIERKFLVSDESWRPRSIATPIRQGYICSLADRLVRVRTVGERAFITIKAAKGAISRYEYEYEIPVKDAAEMLDELCERPLIEKTRHELIVNGQEWVVDVFEGENAGLVMAEVELEDEHQQVPLPPWVGKEVSDDPRYLNVNLARHPYRLWDLTTTP